MLDVYAARLGNAVVTMDTTAAFLAWFMVSFGLCWLVGGVTSRRDETDDPGTPRWFTGKFLSQAFTGFAHGAGGRYIGEMFRTLTRC